MQLPFSSLNISTLYSGCPFLGVLRQLRNRGTLLRNISFVRNQEMEVNLA